MQIIPKMLLKQLYTRGSLQNMNEGDKFSMKNRLKEARFFTGKPQIQLWLETGIHYSTISRIECGYIEPNDTCKKKLAKALNVKKEWLFPKDTKEDSIGLRCKV